MGVLTSARVMVILVSRSKLDGMVRAEFRNRARAAGQRVSLPAACHLPIARQALGLLRPLARRSRTVRITEAGI